MKNVLIVVPVFNEAASLEHNLRCILAAATQGCEQIAFNLLAVDDGSVDGTHLALARFCEAEPRARVLRFTRNFGKESAIAAGLMDMTADTDAVVLIDSDLQHPPELIPQMIELWLSGFKVVEGIKLDRGNETAYARLLASGFYKLFDLLSRLDIRGPAWIFAGSPISNCWIAKSWYSLINCPSGNASFVGWCSGWAIPRHAFRFAWPSAHTAAVAGTP